jgi:hypothetical protein
MAPKIVDGTFLTAQSSGSQKRFWRDDPEQAALIGARIGRRNTG